mgnify:CR=1 FL=1
MDIKSVANIGDTVFYLVPILRETCPVCCGKKQINVILPGDIEKTYDCPECKGKGKIKNKHPFKYAMQRGIIKTIDIIVNDENTTFTYLAEKDSGELKYLCENDCFFTKEDAEKELEFRNLDRPTIPIDQIKIPGCYAKTIPATEKLMQRINEYRVNHRPDMEIYVDENYNLFDGYTAYLIYKMFGHTEIPVVIFPNKKTA